MPPTPPTPPARPPVERRKGGDRRKVDVGPPPGGRERRVGVEPRRPDVQEVNLTQSEWGRLQDAVKPPAPKR